MNQIDIENKINDAVAILIAYSGDGRDTWVSNYDTILDLYRRLNTCPESAAGEAILLTSGNM